jgi:cytochrome c biogenesis protein CcdA
MEALLVGVGSAFLLGLQTAISPCPMATNIAAISFIGRRVTSARSVFLAGLLYALGRTVAYVGLAILLLTSLFARTDLSAFLRTTMNQLLGPILIVVAMFLLDLIRLNFSGPGVSEKLQKRVEAWGLWAALPLGIVFALSFCPFSAVLFFALIPVAEASNSMVVVPSIYGVATALPVVFFALVIAFSAQSLGKAYNRLAQIEWWTRRITGVVFLVVGIYFTLVHIFDVNIRLW